MRRNACIAVFAVAIASLAWLAAPALSLHPYLPPAADFARPLPAVRALDGTEMARMMPAHGEHAGEAVRYVSPVVEAPHEFDLVGLAGEIREVELRVRSRDGEWSPWTDVEGGDPLYTGGSEAVQLRSRSFRPAGELHFVDVSGTSGGLGDRLINSARGSIHDAFVSAAGSPVAAALAPGLAEAARKPARKPPLPPVVSRAAWGADNAGGGCPPRAGPVLGTVGAAVIHHTVSTVDYTPEEAPGIVLGICRFHVYGNGWNDIGYNALVDRFGSLYEGRAGGLAAPIVGAHTEGYNSQTTGVASIGDHTQAPLEPAAMSTLVRYLAWKFAVAAIPARGTTTLVSAGGTTNRSPSGTPVLLGRIFGHGTTNLTECPGPLLDALVPSIRQQVEARIKKFAGKRGKRKHRRRHRHPKS